MLKCGGDGLVGGLFIFENVGGCSICGSFGLAFAGCCVCFLLNFQAKK